MRDKLLLATNNQGKTREYKSLLQNLPFELITPVELGITTKIDETGETLEENARLKATTLATKSQLIALADDSGLEVDALGGEPGPMSARYAGEEASDKERVDYLLAKLADVPCEKRTARFKCVLAISTPAGRTEFCTGKCEGFITFAPKGELGFGYDPVFYLPGLNKTLAELPLEEKNQVSHRGQAARKVYQTLKNLKRQQKC